MGKLLIIIVLSFFPVIASAQRHDQPNNLILSYGIDKNVADDLNSVFGGLGHEFFPLSFMGLQVDGEIGRMRDNISLSEIKNDIIRISSFRISGTYTILSATPRLYLTLNDEDDNYLALFLEYSVGAWRMWGEGSYQNPESEKYSGPGDTGFRYFQGMAVGFRTRMFPNVSGYLTLGGNNISYNRYIESIRFNTPNEIERPGLSGALVIGVGMIISLLPEKKKH
jgi:hypothetical protein